MNTQAPVATIILALITAAVSYQGFRDFSFREKYKFNVGAIKNRNEYFRLLSAGFLHANWYHLLINMVVLYLFGQNFEVLIGRGLFIMIYFVSMVGGNLVPLYIRRYNPEYSALGASGAVAGVLFAGIVMLGGGTTFYLFFLLPMPAWLVATGYILYSLYGIRAQRDNIAHEAHLGGAITGVLMAILTFPILKKMYPNVPLELDWLLIFALTAPVVIAFIIYLRNPAILFLPMGKMGKIGSTGYRRQSRMRVVRDENPERTMQQELDELLEKVGKKGIKGLSKKEKERLDELSERLKGRGGPRRID